jgi:hypothetical protein
MLQRNQDPAFIEDQGGDGALTPARLEMQSTTELVRAFLKEGRSLVKDEVYLAKVELEREVKKAVMGAIAVSAGLGAAFLAFIVLAFGVVFLLAKVMDAWLAAFIVGGALLLGAFIILESGMHQVKKTRLKPEQTLRTIKEDGQWIRETLRDLRSPKPGTT